MSDEGEDERGRRDFAGEAAELERLKETQRDVAVARLRALHEAWARALVGVEDEGGLVPRVRAAVEAGLDPERAAEAIQHLEAAEQHQWEVGTWATGSGEGLSSMFEVRVLQLARAWLWLAIAPRADAAHPHDTARELLESVVGDPNDMGRRLKAHTDALAARLNAAR